MVNSYWADCFPTKGDVTSWRMMPNWVLPILYLCILFVYFPCILPLSLSEDEKPGWKYRSKDVFVKQNILAHSGIASKGHQCASGICCYVLLIKAFLININEARCTVEVCEIYGLFKPHTCFQTEGSRRKHECVYCTSAAWSTTATGAHISLARVRNIPLYILHTTNILLYENGV